jgi:hypothetical protein
VPNIQRLDLNEALIDGNGEEGNRGSIELQHTVMRFQQHLLEGVGEFTRGASPCLKPRSVKLHVTCYMPHYSKTQCFIALYNNINYIIKQYKVLL